MVDLYYTLSRNEPIITLDRIISKLNYKGKKFKIRFETDLTDMVKLYRTLSFLFEEFNFNTQFETNMEYLDLDKFLKKFFMFLRSNNVVEDLKIKIISGDVTILISERDKKIVVQGEEDILKSLTSDS